MSWCVSHSVCSNLGTFKKQHSWLVLLLDPVKRIATLCLILARAPLWRTSYHKIKCPWGGGNVRIWACALPFWTTASWNSCSHITEPTSRVSACARIGFPGNQILRSSACSVFRKEWSWDGNLGKLGEGSRIGQREKLSCVTGPAKVLADCMGARELKLGQVRLACIVSHQSVIECGMPVEWAWPWVRQPFAAEQS